MNKNMTDPHPQTLRKRSITNCLLAALALTAILWWIHVNAWLMGWNLAALGVYPGRMTGLIGLVTAPLIHGSFQHLVSNTPPMILLGTGLFYGYPRSWYLALPILWVGSGLGIWLIGRESFHFGASGVTTGLMFFLFFAGVFRRDRLGVVLAMASFFLYGSMIWGIFPTEAGISFEAHFSGAALGAVCAFVFRNRDPRVPWRKRRYSWEDEPEDHKDPVIGDEWKLPEQRERDRNRLH